MAKDSSNATTPKHIHRTTHDGNRPFEKGYQPTTAQASQGEPATQTPPKPPTGGTGQKPPQNNPAKNT